jgi:hypothetical protein
VLLFIAKSLKIFHSLHYWPALEPHYAPVPQEASVGHVQTISTDVKTKKYKVIDIIESYKFYLRRSSFDTVQK